MLIDDDHITNFLHKILIDDLAICGEVEITNNGEEGLKVLEDLCRKGKSPELILVDLKMPVMDGFEFVDAFLKLPQQVQAQSKVVVLTTSSNPNDIQRICSLGITDYYNKPLTPDIMKDIMGKNFPA